MIQATEQLCFLFLNTYTRLTVSRLGLSTLQATRSEEYRVYRHETLLAVTNICLPANNYTVYEREVTEEAGRKASLVLTSFMSDFFLLFFFFISAVMELSQRSQVWCTHRASQVERIWQSSLTTVGLKNLVCKWFGEDVVKSVREKERERERGGERKKEEKKTGRYTSKPLILLLSPKWQMQELRHKRITHVWRTWVLLRGTCIGMNRYK